MTAKTDIEQPVAVTVIMPAYNAAGTIGLSLASIKKQRFDPAQIEIMVVDGGSTDATREIASGFGATVVSNPKRQQEYAKHLGLTLARGRYAIFMDADEVFAGADAIRRRINFFAAHPEVKNIICSGLLTPPGYPSICDYINSLGDPFYFYLNRIDAGNLVASLGRRYANSPTGDSGMIVRFSRRDLLPVIDSGTHMFDLSFLRQQFAESCRRPDMAPLVFAKMARLTNCLGVLRDDFIYHHSVSSLPDYIGKLDWKIIANIHYPRLPGVGYSNRARSSRRLKLRGVGFVFYTLSLVMPLYDSLFLALRKGNPVFLLHLFLCWHTLLYVAWQMCLRKIGITPRLPVYGKSSA